MSLSAQQEQLLFGDMVVERELGEGGMGKVQLVRSRSTGERFAVKRTKFRDWAGQRNFLLELMTWYGLPRHPNLVECRFFRTLQNDETGESEIAIFAEYVPGGSLADWIVSGKLYEGGPEKALERILDIAIQFAWGLHTAHELGVVHQDVKPGNVILTSDGVLKVADFGLARARARAGEATRSDSAHSILVSSGGKTLAYCSPEQFAGERLTRKTDVWSWGVSILDMFTGKPNKSIGARAHRVVLKEYLEAGVDDLGLPAMPAGLVEILRKCFCEDPAERWATMADVAEGLLAVFRHALGREYSGSVPPLPDGNGAQAVEHDRRRTDGSQWDDPRNWLVLALQAAQRDPAEAEGLLVRTSSRKAQPIADLVGYEQARRILEQAIAGGCQDLASTLAQLCHMKAMVHEHVDDRLGAFTLYDQAIAIRELLVYQQGRHELAGHLATTYQNKSIVLGALGDLQGAVALCNQAIALYERLMQQEWRPELAGDVALIYVNKANALQRLGDLQGAVAVYDQAIDIKERLVFQQGRHEFAGELAVSYQNKAVALQSLGDLQGAVALCDQAIGFYEWLVQQRGRHELAGKLALTYQNKANALQLLGNLRGAVPLYDQAIAVFERLVQQQGRHELADDLAGAYQNKAAALQLLNLRGALTLHDQAIALYERLVQQQGRHELADHLASAYQNKANALQFLGDLQGTVALYDQAIAIRERLVQQHGRHELAGKLAGSYQNKANALQHLGDLRGVVALYEQAIALYERLVQQGRNELANDLAGAYQNKANALQRLGDPRGAVPLYDQGIALYEWLVQQQGRNELANDLALTYSNKAHALNHLGDLRGAVVLCDQAIALYERLMQQERPELGGDLAGVKVCRAKFLRDLGQRALATTEAREAVAVLRTEVEINQRADLQSVLDWATSTVLTVDGATAESVSSNLGAYGGSRPHPDSDPNRAMQLNLQYQKSLSEWRSLPVWKRLLRTRPERPSGI